MNTLPVVRLQLYKLQGTELPVPVLVYVLQREPQPAHGKQEEGPVDHALVVLKGRGAGYQGVSGTGTRSCLM